MSFFRPVPGEEEHTNPGCYGKALARWLAERLQERGVPVEGVIPEDFGWVVMISRKPFMLWLACSNTEDSTHEWMVYPVAELSLLQRLFNRVDPAPELERLRSHLAEMIPSIPASPMSSGSECAEPALVSAEPGCSSPTSE